ncbi:hypothetical protein F4778DRAFT_199069 [Xylariomycetidae sp. FL2044]|nr:hypothetical protein F4778DRAFT_199069 [Xylariomycetidae sp. FL2044]
MSSAWSLTQLAGVPLASVHIEAAWVFCAFTYILTHHSFPVVQKTLRVSKDHSRNYILVAHVALSLIEVFRYHVRAVVRYPRPVVPDLLDLLVSVAHAYTSLSMVRDRQRGDRVFSRPSQQSLAIIKTGYAVAAWASRPRNPATAAFYHLGVVRIMNAFVYPRVIIKLAGSLGVLPHYSAVYAASMFLSCLLSLHDAQIRGGPQLFIAIFVLNLIVNRWVAGEVVKSEKHGQRPSGIVRALHRAGFFELKALRDNREAT